MSDDDPTTPEPPIEPAGGPPTEPIPIVPQTPDPEIAPTEAIPVVPDPALPPTASMAPMAAPMTPTDPNYAIPNDQPDPRWYENRAATAAMIAVGLLVIFLLVAWLLWWSDDDDDAIEPTNTIGTAVVVDGSTIVTTESSTIPPPSVVAVTPVSTVFATLPPETSAPTTAPATTAATTVAPTTAPTTEATTTTAATTTTTSVPVVSVPPGPSATVMDILAASPDLSRLEELVTQAGLTETLAGEEPFTLFAPSNQAIETLEASPGGAELLADPERLRNLLLGHVVPEALDAATIFSGGDLTTASGSVLAVDPEAETVGGANVVVIDVEGANGVLHVVDRVFDEA